jgi:ferredoxin-NADP reductase
MRPCTSAQDTMWHHPFSRGISHDSDLLQVQVSQVMGNGFSVDSVPPAIAETMLIFATGSGISPIKALIDADALEATSRKDVRLYYGTTDIDSMAYADRCAPPKAFSCTCMLEFPSPAYSELAVSCAAEAHGGVRQCA